MEQSKASLRNAPFNTYFDNNQFYIVLKEEVREDGWSEHIGLVYQSLLEKKINNLLIDFSNCFWIDLIPLMYFILFIDEFEANGGTVTIRLPDFAANTQNSINNQNLTKTQVLLKFLAQEGFLDLLKGKYNEQVDLTQFADIINPNENHKRIVIFESGEEVSSQSITDILNSNLEVNYKNSRCFPVTFLKLSPSIKNSVIKRDEFIEDIVSQIMSHYVSISIDLRLPFWARSSMKYRVSTIFRETIRNSIEHAYNEDKDALRILLYIRYRVGKLDTNLTFQTCEDVIEKENKHSVVLGRSFHDRRRGYFESFIIDSGNGLQSTNKKEKYLQSIIKKIFDFNPKSRSVKTTDIGGLGLIGKILTNQMDQVRVQSNGEWWSKIFPDEKPAKVWTKSSREKHTINGTSWLFRTSWRENQDFLNNGWCHPYCSGKVPVYLSENDNFGENNKNIQILDWRFEFNRENPNYNISIPSRTTMLFLPPPRLSKDEIINFTNSILEKLTSQNITFIVADIPPEEAITYSLAFMQTYNINEKYFTGIKDKIKSNKLKKLILVTRHLSTNIYTKKQSKKRDKTIVTFEHDERSSQAFINGLEHKPENNLSYLHRLLRWFDSTIFWKVISQDCSTNSYFIKGNIRWSEELELSSYLDLGKALINNTCAQIVSLSLSRLSLIVDESSNYKFSYLDNTLQSIVEEVNANLHLSNDSQELISVGSICVSQVSEKQHLTTYPTDSDSNPNNVVYIFKHTESKANVAYLLMWPDNKWEWYDKLPNNNRKLMRVGTSSVIAEYGWLGYPLHRFEDEKSIYHRTPKKSYDDWQDSNVELVKLGHWEYEGHHDLITINIQQAFRADYEWHRNAKDSSLFSFLANRLFSFLNLRLCDVDEKHQWKISKVLNNKTKIFVTPINTLVYPSHPVTDYIISTFINILTPLARKFILPAIIPLKPVRNSRDASSFLISGLTLDNLRYRARLQDSLVKIFDDAMISGRISFEIEKLLKSVGFDNISNIFILDRQRLPSSKHIIEGITECYWRLDIPLLGSNITCPICSSLRLLDVMTNRMVNSDVKDRLNNILNTWKVKNTITQWHENGVSGIYLKNFQKIRKKFGIEIKKDKASKKGFITNQIGGDTEKIELKNSLGISIYLTEMHTMTFNDDLLSNFLRKNKDLSKDAKLEFISTQLLYFSNELDKKNKEAFITGLFYELLDANEVSIRTSLSLITLLANLEVLHHLLMTFDLKNGTKINQDFLILLVYAATSIKGFERYKFIEVERLLLEKNKLITYHWFSRQVKDVYGEQHTGYIHLLTKAGQWTSNIDLRTRIISVLHNLLEVTNLLDWENFNSHQNNSNIEDSNQLKIELKIELKKHFDILVKKLSSFDNKDTQNYSSIREQAQDSIVILNKIHSGFFMPIFIRNKTLPFEHLEDEIEKIIESECNTVNVRFTRKNSDAFYDKREKIPFFKEVYILFDRIIKDTLVDLIKNSSHGTEDGAPKLKFKDPFGRIEYQDSCIEVNFTEQVDGIIINIKNNSITSSKIIDKKILNKPKPYITEFKDRPPHNIFRKSHKKTDHYVVTTTLTLPFVHKFGG